MLCNRTHVTLGLLLALAPAAVAAAQTPGEPNRIPLSSYRFYSIGSAEGIYERQVDPGTLRIGFSDLVPTHSYDISWHTVNLIAPPFTIPADLPSNLRRGGVPITDPCDGLRAQANEVWAATTEAEVAQRVPVLRLELATTTCTDQAAKTTAQTTIDATLSKQVIETKIEEGTILTVTVSRRGESAVFVFEGPPPPRFFQTYGFSYLEDGSEEFFTQETPEGKHVILPKARRSDWEPAGLLLLNYRLFGPWKSTGDLSVNLAGALSFDGEDPSVGLGLNFTLANNLGLVVGVAMSEETRLRGEYTAGPDGTLLDQALASDQLVEDDPHETWFVGLSLNLSSNPFKKKQPETTTKPAVDGAK